MSNLFKPVHIITLVLIVGLFILKFFGIDGVVDLAITAIVGFYFGLNTPSPDQKNYGQGSSS